MPDSDQNTRPRPEEKIKTHGLELVFIGTLLFAALITLTILAYKVFIVKRVKSSTEYLTATYFIENSEMFKEELSSPVYAMAFDDINVSEKENYGVCEIRFTLLLKSGLTTDIQLGLIKAADFWIVYETILDPGTPNARFLTSTYQKILMIMERLNYQDGLTAEVLLKSAGKEMLDHNLLHYLQSRVKGVLGLSTDVAQILDGLVHRVHHSRLAVLYEQALNDFVRQNYDKARLVFEQILTEYEQAKVQEQHSSRLESIFAGLPLDPFLAGFNHDNIQAETFQNLALTYHELGEHEKGLEMAELALKKAEEIKSTVVWSSALFVKALNLYKLERYEEAEKTLDDVISDMENPNLSQKAWAYYYKADIAARFSRPRDSIDYYETAVVLDPFNYVIRRGAIEYLMSRGGAGDMEIALALAIRGVHYEEQKGLFEMLAERIRQRM